jgi:hypothetical protein
MTIFAKLGPSLTSKTCSQTVHESLKGKHAHITQAMILLLRWIEIPDAAPFSGANKPLDRCPDLRGGPAQQHATFHGA